MKTSSVALRLGVLLTACAPVAPRGGGIITRVLLRVDALDATGTVIASDVRPLDRYFPPNDRVDFDVPPPVPAPAYHVKVEAVLWRDNVGVRAGTWQEACGSRSHRCSVIDCSARGLGLMVPGREHETLH